MATQQHTADTVEVDAAQEDAPQVMRVVFKGEDLGTFTDRRMTVSETILLKQRTGLSTKEFLEGIGEIDGQALQALVWLLKLRKKEAINPKELDFELGELRLEREADPTQPTSANDGSAT
ncbi:MAG: hypothetical protein HIU88_10255 [Acidobacteria bacterium]|nr:hypothetical protein [Acidobacteriota bacterium]